MRVERIGDATLYLGDARELAADLGFDVVVTDPPWDQASGIPGAEDPRALFAALAPDLSRARLVAVQLGCYTDPLFLAPLGGRLRFLHACWLEYVPPSYRGRVLVEADIAYVYGEAPRSRPGARVLPSKCVAASRLPAEQEFVRGHGRNRTGSQARATAAALPHPMARRLKHVQWLVRWHSDEGDTVFDPLMGSGTTGIACACVGRPFVGIEIEPHSFDLACRRIEDAQRQGKLFEPEPKGEQAAMWPDEKEAP